MADSIHEILKPSDAPYKTSKIYGSVIGVVTSLKDPEKMGRVKVKFPWMSEKEESWWCRLATMMAGKERGSWFVPEVEDEVLVVFEHGDVRFPYVIGALWNGKDKPPFGDDVLGGISSPGGYSPAKPATNTADGDNDYRFIRSRSGHLLWFDDTEGEEQLALIEHNGNAYVQLQSKELGKGASESPANKDRVVIGSETGDIELWAPKGQVYINAKTIVTESSKYTKMSSGDVFFAEAQKDMKLTTKMNLTAKSSINSKFESGANTDIKAGAMMNIKSGAIMKIESSALMQVKAAAPLICKGAVIMLN